MSRIKHPEPGIGHHDNSWWLLCILVVVIVFLLSYFFVIIQQARGHPMGKDRIPTDSIYETNGTALPHLCLLACDNRFRFDTSLEESHAHGLGTV